jgi:putative membrane protein
MLVAAVRNGPSALLGIVALAYSNRANPLWVLTAATALLVLAGLLSWLRWSRFTYALTADAVVIESGLFSRNRRTIPYERLADVGIERGPAQRLLGLARVTLETGAAGANDGVLDSVRVAEAERLREVVRRRRGATIPSSGEALTHTASSSPADLVFAMDRQRVLISGLFSFSLVWIAVAVGALQSVGGALGLDNLLWNTLSAKAEDVRSVPLIVWARASVIAAVAALALGVVAGIARTGLRDYGFRLSDEGGRLRRARGLFTRSEVVIALPRVQLVAIDNGPLRRRFGWSRLRAQVLGGEGAAGRQDLAPLARAEEVNRLLALVRLPRLNPADLTPVSRGHVWRTLLRRAGLPALLLAGASAITPFALLAAPLLPPLIATALLDRRYHRYRAERGLLQVQRGVFGRTNWLVPVTRIQAVTLRRTWLQRRLGLSTVHVDTAGGDRFNGPNVHNLDAADALALTAKLRASTGGGTTAPLSYAASGHSQPAAAQQGTER